MLRRDVIALRKIAEEITVILNFVGEISLEGFLSDELLKRATGMTAINIGELVKNLSEDFRTQYNNIPWKQISGFRDIAAHKYGTLKMDDVYDTVIRDFPALKTQIEEILQDNQ